MILIPCNIGKKFKLVFKFEQKLLSDWLLFDCINKGCCETIIKRQNRS